jgi:hypothetical protein
MQSGITNHGIIIDLGDDDESRLIIRVPLISLVDNVS